MVRFVLSQGADRPAGVPELLWPLHPKKISREHIEGYAQPGTLSPEHSWIKRPPC